MPIVIHPDGATPHFTVRENRFVPAAEVKRALDRGQRIIIMDARATSDWLRMHIPGALPVPYYELGGIVEELPRDGTWMIAYCACPHAASGHLVDALRAQGFTNAVILDEGIHFWEEQDYPVVSGASPEGTDDEGEDDGTPAPTGETPPAHGAAAPIPQLLHPVERAPTQAPPAH